MKKCLQKLQHIECRSALSVYLLEEQVDINSSNDLSKLFRYVNNELVSTETVDSTRIATSITKII